jgi:type VI secretion system secreted protein Hcp
MAHVMYMTVRGQKQGTFKGEGSARGKGRILLVSFEMGAVSPRDAASGLPSGKRQYQPVKVGKEIGASSPQFLSALATNENLVSVDIEFLSTDTEGEETVDFTIELTNASVASFAESIDTGEAGGPLVDTRRLERIEFTFQKIAMADIPGDTSFADDWTVAT